MSDVSALPAPEVVSPATDDALKFDLEQSKRLGFNTARKHQKVEPDRWYYHADTLGIMVWQDMPATPIGRQPPHQREPSPPPPAAVAGNSAAPGKATASGNVAVHQEEPDILKRFEAAVPKLGPWPEQKPRIQKLVANVRAELKKIAAGSGTPQQKDVLRQSLHKKAQDGLDHILTVAQTAKLKQLMGGQAPKDKK